jgi:membrane associated rhomboid family serine protease
MIPFRDENPTSRPAVLTYLIIGACLVAYLVWQPSPFSETSEDTPFNYEYAAIPCEVVEGRPLDVGEILATPANQEACGIDGDRSPEAFPDKNAYVPILTSMFLHASLLHIGGNMLFLWVFGNNIEDVMGKVAFAMFYVTGGIVATLTHVVLNLDSTVPLVGASGAIAAVMGAYMVLYPHARIRTVVFLLLIFVVNVRAVWLLGFWLALQFFTDPNEGVAWAAHVGGFVFGVVVGLLVRAVKPPAPIGRQRYHWRGA